MTPSVDDLARLVRWTGHGVVDLDWGYVESELGIALPRDYIALVERFSRGRFNGSLELIQPWSSASVHVENYLDEVFREAERLTEAVQEIQDLPEDIARDMLALPRHVFPRVPGLFPWAQMEGEYLVSSYLTGRPREVASTFIARIPYGTCVRLDGPLVQCILDMITGRVRRVSGLLSTDAPPRFVAVAPPEPRPLRPPLTYAVRRSDVGVSLGHRAPIDAVDNLRDLGLDTSRAQVVDWPAVEQWLGRCLPSDYKRFIEEIGPGRYGNIVVASPNGPTADAPGIADVLSNLRNQADALYSTRPPVLPEPGGPLVWGEAPRGWFCGWMLDDSPTDSKVAMTFSVDGQYSETTFSMTGYLDWYLRRGEAIDTAPWSRRRPGDARRHWKAGQHR